MRMWPFAKAEHRESATDAIVSALISQAGGSSVPPSVEALGAVEAAAGLWSRAFASATVEPQTLVTNAVTPAVLAAIGRGLAVRGEVVFELAVNGAVELTQAASWKVSGGTRPESWRYSLEIPLPAGGVVKKARPAEAVLHLRYATRPGAPWAWQTKRAPWPHGLNGVLRKKPAPPQATCSHFPKPPTWTSSKPI